MGLGAGHGAARRRLRSWPRTGGATSTTSTQGDPVEPAPGQACGPSYRRRLSYFSYPLSSQVLRWRMQSLVRLFMVSTSHITKASPCIDEALLPSGSEER
jgi:hypothetical protein